VVPPASRRISRVLRYSGSRLYFVLSPTGLLPSPEPLPFGLRLELFRFYDPATPVHRSGLVWPLAASLAATEAIEFSFSSSGYLDVSVHRVPSSETMDSSQGDRTSFYRVSPFGYLRLNVCLRLPVAFRSLPRPSSAIGARASTLCSFQLDPLQTSL
jgi:hypothetical protein